MEKVSDRNGKRYLSIAEQLFAEVREGKYSAHHSFPSLTRIMRRFSVARATAAKSVEELKKPRLTTVRQNRDKMGSAVFRRLLERIENPDLPANEILFPAPLIVRESTRQGKEKLK